ncbi:MAG: hypothetical protein PUK70_00350 [Bacteroidales bacterium]|nr:hypothetical protein [Bacteroidales bacterium]MDY6002286.1 DUF6577 family protein [Candidatus Cryptobacteroides sp.]
MSELQTHILEYASSHPSFSIVELLSATPKSILSSRATLEWYLGQLTKNGKLSRIGKGRYSSRPHSIFIPQPRETDAELFHQLKTAYPEATFCIYKGSIFAPLQHHLSYNAMTYIETQRELTEVLFHRFQGEGKVVFHRPNKKILYDYIDISKPIFIIKPLITGSPLQEVTGITVPTLEKLLVDIRCDADFDYMGGSESARMLENAVSLYAINTTKLFRYAGRRHCREQFMEEFNQLGL